MTRDPQKAQQWRYKPEWFGEEVPLRAQGAEFAAPAPSLSRASRRDVMQLMAAAMALAGLSGCDPEPDPEAIPYVEAPEGMTANEPRFYATATLLSGYATPVLVETRMGRPIKVEGNGLHPLTGGGTSAFTQAEVLNLYDPDRSRSVTYLGRPVGWSRMERALFELGLDLRKDGGERFAILSGAETSPTLRRQMAALQERLPKMRWFVHEPALATERYDATRRVFGQALDLHYAFEGANVVLSLDDDFLGPGPAQVERARHWSERRKRSIERGDPLALFVAEPAPTLTGAKASRRLSASLDEIQELAKALAAELGLGGIEAPDLQIAHRAWVKEAADALKRHGDAAMVTAGPHLPATVQSLVFHINDALGSLHRTLLLREPVAPELAEEDRSIERLVDAIAANEVQSLFLLDVNPVYTAPSDLDFTNILQRVPLRIHAGVYSDETADSCQWHAPLAHSFERWSDARASDGTATILQPLIRPLFGGRQPHELLAILGGELNRSALSIVQDTWRTFWPEDDFDQRWRQALHDGFIEGTESRIHRDRPSGQPPTLPQADSGNGELSLIFRPHPTIWDGRFANNAWLQELPTPFERLTWDNAIHVSPALAERAKLANGMIVSVKKGMGRITGPVWINPGTHDSTLVATLGYGRQKSGRAGTNVGYDAYALRLSDALWHVPNISLEPGGEQVVLASAQYHQELEFEHIIEKITPEDLASGKKVQQYEERSLLYPQWNYPDAKWGMVIDLDACIGCNACVVACQSENNVPTVGKAQVALGREMHWLRVDTYYEGDPADPEIHFQPVPCMHCEKAPCEMGCPVNATVHGHEGLNEMIYNRCIGTRTCASYCPYKVRRFNYLDFTDTETPGRVPQRNPEVTVRSRGVMEKCTYCIQRIAAARITADREGRDIREGEVVTACQAACPTKAIHFGDLNKEDSSVSKLHESPRNYGLLVELNTQPRTSYLAVVQESKSKSKKGGA